MKKSDPEKIKALIKENIQGIDALEIIPVLDLRDALNGTLSKIEKGYIPESYQWTREKTEYAYSYKSYKGWVKSILVSGKYYYTDEEASGDELFGVIARYTWRNNYCYIAEKLTEAITLIEKMTGIRVRFKVLSNYTSLPEKILFRGSGLADIGKNGVLIHREMGSYFTIGEAFMDMEFNFSEMKALTEPDFSLCGSCRICMDTCPTGAIVDNGVLDINRCFQYISENLLLMPPFYREKWGKRLYGCSTCIDVCPHNKNIKPWAEKHGVGYIGQGMNLLDVLNLSEKDFEVTFQNNQISRRGRLSFIKNAIVSLGNTGFGGAVDTLKPYLNHENPVIRCYSAWACGKINTKTAKRILSFRCKSEENPLVRTEIEQFL